MNWFIYSTEQKEYIENSQEKFNLNGNKKIIAIQIQVEIDFLKRFISFSNATPYSLIGFNFNKPHYKIFDLVLTPLYIMKIFEQFFLNKKNYNFHKKINLSQFLTPNLLPFRSLKFLPKSFILFLNLKRKKDILQIKYEEIIIGDLIYETYMRYFKKKTLNIKDFNLIFLLARTFAEINYLEKVSKSIDIYLTGYTTYTNNGLPTRIFTKNDVEVYTFANFINGKKLNINDFSQSKKYWSYRSDFSNLDDKGVKIELGLDLLENRLNGINDLSYMKINPYSSNILNGIKKYDGIVFLHDFFDSNHIFRDALFPDFYEWAVFTFNLIAEHNLNIGIKPHPNQNNNSKKVLEKLKIKFNHLNWLDEEISNSQLFNSGIKFGISVYGTILTELAYNNILPICCGDNPTINYNFTFLAKTREEYIEFILNYEKLMFKENKFEEIGEFVFMNHIN